LAQGPPKRRGTRAFKKKGARAPKNMAQGPLKRMAQGPLKRRGAKGAPWMVEFSFSSFIALCHASCPPQGPDFTH